MSKHLIGLDLLGGDLPPADLLKEIAAQLDGAHLALFGTSDVIVAYNQLDLAHLSVEFIPVEEIIELNEDPLTAIRQKKSASVHIGMRLLKEGHISAYLGIGNTGAMLAAAKIHLPPLPSNPRPALLAMLPTQNNPVAVLDVGANLSAKTEHFIEMARMGIAFQKTRGIEMPKVALLNIGSEEVKGHKELREAYKKLKSLFPENFVGNIEGKDVFKGAVDVLVTDGFTGNVFLKTAEGVTQYLLNRFESLLPNNEAVTQNLDTETFPGALLLGLNHVVVKCHSYASGLPIALTIKATEKLLAGHLIENLH